MFYFLFILLCIEMLGTLGGIKLAADAEAHTAVSIQALILCLEILGVLMVGFHILS